MPCCPKALTVGSRQPFLQLLRELAAGYSLTVKPFSRNCPPEAKGACLTQGHAHFLKSAYIQRPVNGRRRLQRPNLLASIWGNPEVASNPNCQCIGVTWCGRHWVRSPKTWLQSCFCLLLLVAQTSHTNSFISV